MKRLIKISLSVCTVLLFAMQMNMLTSCNDDMSAESYYTFTGEMMSDFLKNREDFSLFRQIVERAGEMVFLGTRGSRTFFPPTNEGVEAYLTEMGYSSVDDIPADYCDTLVKACLVDDHVLYTYDMANTQQETNELGLPLIIVTEDSVLDENGLVQSVINSSSAIINSLKNDSVENGVVHPVDQMLIPNTSVGSVLLDDNHSEYEIYYEALRRTGLLDSLARFRDQSYETWKENYPEYQSGIHSGDFTYVIKRPDHLDQGYTVFVVPDKVLYEKYPEYFNESMSMDEKIDGLYKLAVSKYNDSESAQIFGLNEKDSQGRTYKDLYWNENALTSRYNPLNMFLSYHMLDRLYESTAKLVNCWGINTNYADPTEWITTMLDISMLKVERVYSSIDPQIDQAGGFYLNHTIASVYNSYERVRGAKVTQPASNFSINCAFYYLDDVIAYDNTMRSNIMNTRMRIDVVTLWPELTNNGMRLHGTPWKGYDATTDNTESTLNYNIPSGYLKNTTVNESSIFLVQRPKYTFWNMGGDEINFLGSSYDITFRLPPVPPGTYELRMGYAGMSDRGIAQVYVDGKPEGTPLDLRYNAADSRVGGIYGVDLTDEELEENNRTMKNNGYYRGPASVYTYKGGADSKYTQPTYYAPDCDNMNENKVTYRRKLADVTIDYHTYHTVRVRSVWVQGNSGCFMFDYLELVPYSICGAGGLGEDEY